MTLFNSIIDEDLEIIYQRFDRQDFFKDSTILITGCAGFLGYYFLNFFVKYTETLQIKQIIGVDNFITGNPKWIGQLLKHENHKIKIHSFDVINDDLSDIKGVENANIVLHMASVASPTFYRQFPIETLDANIWGLRKLLDYYRDKSLLGFLMFSSSEVYGDPDSKFIPTPESYLGNVSTIGPRACYDEAKRFSETLCYLYAEKYNMPITLARPFNNYGPGMRLDDKRVPADFANAIVKNKNIEMFSDGTPTRTFCYISDAIIGYLKVLTHRRFDIFNIGNDKPEIQIIQLANIFVEIGKDIFGYNGNIELVKSKDRNYLTHNPNRRCPIIEHARVNLNFTPTVTVEEGVRRFLKFLKIESNK